jgi:Protein of unknown function (DUF732)
MTKKICGCSFGVLLALLLGPTAVASADQTDADFTNYLDSHGVHLGTTDQTVNMARVMCHDLDAGYTQTDEVDQLTGAHRLSQPQAQLFVGAATADYCPKYHSPNRPRGK